MAVKMLSGMALAALLLTTAAEAQSIAQVGGPANPPPASFKGQQFVDSRGCLFLRAGFGRNVNWVARIDRNRKPICGMIPMGSAAAQAAVAADMAPDVQTAPAQSVADVGSVATAAPRVKGAGWAWLFGPAVRAPSPAPAPTVLSTQTAAATVAVAPPAPAYQGTGVATSVAGVQCYPTAPKLERVTVTGGTALICTRGDGTTAGWRPPLVANGAQVQVAARKVPLMAAPFGAALVANPAPVRVMAVQVAAPVAALQPPVVVAQPVVRSHSLPKPPKGWVMAWKDDRLNPLRGVGTAEGQAQQDAVWQRTVPLVLVTDPVPKASGVRKTVATRVAVSTMSAPQAQGSAQTAAGKLTIQIGSFGIAANAQSAAARLAALGLPVSKATTTRKGKTLQIVSAGPFTSAAEANARLAVVRGAGFADAFLR